MSVARPGLGGWDRFLEDGKGAQAALATRGSFSPPARSFLDWMNDGVNDGAPVCYVLGCGSRLCVLVLFLGLVPFVRFASC